MHRDGSLLPALVGYDCLIDNLSRVRTLNMQGNANKLDDMQIHLLSGLTQGEQCKDFHSMPTKPFNLRLFLRHLPGAVRAIARHPHCPLLRAFPFPGNAE